jgi:hypothetical protein
MAYLTWLYPKVAVDDDNDNSYANDGDNDVRELE